MSRPFSARFRGYCMHCHRPIEVGDPIQADNPGVFVHVDCGASRIAYTQSLARRLKRNREIANIAYHRVHRAKLARLTLSFIGEGI